jgi:hypothetical protein
MQLVVTQLTESLIWWVKPVTWPVTLVVGGSAKGKHVVVRFPTFFHPDAFFLHDLEIFSSLEV